MKNKKLNLLTMGIIVLVVLVIVLIIYGVVADKKNKSGEKQKTVVDINTGQVVDPELLEIYRMEEYERIRYYFSKYVRALEEGKYQAAYDMLHDDFKDNYFKTVESYTSYVQSKYLPVMSVEYDAITRLGQNYVLTINFLDVFNSTDEEKIISKTQKVIINENNYNDFKMSFQAE